jgi:hypothetical protein
MAAQRLAVVDQPVGPHNGVQRFALTADVDACGYLIAQPLVTPDSFGQPRRLICGQGVHGVEDNGLDARLLSVAVTVIEDRIEKALGLARTGAGGDEGGLRRMAVGAGEPLKRAHLMHVGRKGGPHRQWDRIIVTSPAKRQAQIDIGSFEKTRALILKKTQQRPFHPFILEVEGGGQVIE